MWGVKNGKVEGIDVENRTTERKMIGTSRFRIFYPLFFQRSAKKLRSVEIAGFEVLQQFRKFLRGAGFSHDLAAVNRGDLTSGWFGVSVGP